MSPSKKIESITLWRVIACLGVFAVHLGQRMNLSGGIRLISDFGKYGVQLFFIISGILSMEQMFRWKGTTLSYWYKRAVRILPLYYFVILYYFLSETFIWKDIPVDETGLGWMRYLFFLSGFVKNDTYFWSNLGITWTIPVFVLFYFLVPFIFKRVKDLKSSIVLYIVFLLLAEMIKIFCNGNLAAITYLPFFAEGIIIFFAKKEKRENLVIFLSSVALIGKLILGNIDSTAYSFIFMSILIAAWEVQIPSGKIKKILLVLDKYSYTIYLGHGLIFCGFIDKYSFSPAVVFGIAVCGTSLLVYSVYNFIEYPIQKFLKSIVNER